MKKTAFSLVELIFSIVLIGVLTGIGFYMNRSDPTRADAQYALIKLKEARYRAIGYESSTVLGANGRCIVLSKDALSNDVEPAHKIKSAIALSSVMTYENPAPHSLNGNEICFDGLGRPHEGNSVALSTLLSNDLNATFSNTTYNTTIRIFSQSGYSAITCKN